MIMTLYFHRLQKKEDMYNQLQSNSTGVSVYRYAEAYR